MKITTLIITTVILQVSAASYAQRISLSKTNASLVEIFKEIQTQTAYDFIYTTRLIQKSNKVNIDVKNASINEVLDKCFAGQPLTYSISSNTIIVKPAPLSSGLRDVRINGTVRDEKGLPLPGVSVKLKGTSFSTITDVNGSYTLTVPDASGILQFSYIGFKTKEVSAGGRATVDVVLEESVSELSQVVVIGYGAVQKKDLTGSVSVVNIQELAKAPVSSFADALAGRVAGLQVASIDGQPGGVPNIVIRGPGSITQSNSPLYVIDGFPVEDQDPAALNVEDIESMTILKDASSAAVYGSRAANGVILIQTKRGKAGKPVLNYSTSLGLQAIRKKMDVMSPYEFVKYQNELYGNEAATKEYFSNGRTLDYYRNVEGISWQDQVFKTGKVQIHNIALRGGNADTKYSISGSIYDQDAIVINTGLDRYTARVTVDQNINNKLRAGVNSSYSHIKSYGQQVNQSPASSVGLVSSALLFRTFAFRPLSADPTEDLLSSDIDGDQVSGNDIRINPVIDMENQYQFDRNGLLEGNAYVTYDITPDLNFKVTGGVKLNTLDQDRFFNSKTAQASPGNVLNMNGVHGSVRTRNQQYWSNEYMLNYKKTINEDHTITGLGLFGMNNYKTIVDAYSARNVPNESLGMDGLDQGQSFNPVSSTAVHTLVSYVTRLDYTYKSKYTLTGTFRADASSKFKEHWGYFPAAALRWNMHAEPFMKALPFISNSSIRASYGSTGNNRVDEFEQYAQLTQNIDGYPMNNQVAAPIFYISKLGNEKLKWETTTSLDIGYELGLFNNRVRLETDVYRKTTSDLLLNANMPPSTGYTRAFKNVGKLRNDGIEFTLNTINIASRAFNWSSNFNISFNKNKILGLAEGEYSLRNNVAFDSNYNTPLYLAEIGQPLGMMFGFVWDGNYQYADFDNPAPDVYVLKSSVAASGTTRGNIRPGDIKYRDLNGDGDVTDLDKTIIGRGQPIHTGGFSNNLSYKSFNLNVLFQWSYGNDILNGTRINLEGNPISRRGVNQFASYINRWSPENQTNDNYRTAGQGVIGRYSSKVVEDGSYLRLKTLSLDYNIPARYITKLYLKNLSLNVTGQNLLTMTKYTGLDPESSSRHSTLTPGFDFSAYPQAQTLVFGLKATF